MKTRKLLTMFGAFRKRGSVGGSDRGLIGIIEEFV